jgi:hypothetical protein
MRATLLRRMKWSTASNQAFAFAHSKRRVVVESETSCSLKAACRRPHLTRPDDSRTTRTYLSSSPSMSSNRQRRQRHRRPRCLDHLRRRTLPLLCNPTTSPRTLSPTKSTSLRMPSHQHALCFVRARLPCEVDAFRPHARWRRVVVRCSLWTTRVILLSYFR